MKTVKFEVTIELPDSCTPYQSPELQAGIIWEIIQHRAHFLYGNGGGNVTVIPSEREFNWEHANRELSPEALERLTR